MWCMCVPKTLLAWRDCGFVSAKCFPFWLSVGSLSVTPHQTECNIYKHSNKQQHFNGQQYYKKATIRLLLSFLNVNLRLKTLNKSTSSFIQWWHSFVHVLCHSVHLLPGSRAICHFRQPSRHSPGPFCWGGRSRGTTSAGQREHGGWRRRWSAGWRWCLLPFRGGQNILGKTMTRYLRAFWPWSLTVWRLNDIFKENGSSTAKALGYSSEGWYVNDLFLT